MLQGRITREQMDWLEAKADEVGGNLSAALRQALTDARFLEMARLDYRQLKKEHPGFAIPRHEDTTTRVVEWVLGMRMSETEDLELREAEARGEQARED
jgi:hypothetical protein